jgi:Uma2 family endonuclease
MAGASPTLASGGRRLTADDLERIVPESGQRYELIDGELSVTPAPILKHQIVSGKLYTLLSAHVHPSRKGLVLTAPVDVRFDQDHQVQPDLVYVTAERFVILKEKRIEGVPDLVVEILSPGTAFDDLNRKRLLYERFGVPHYWVASPEEETLRAFALGADGRYRLAYHAMRDETVRLEPFPEMELPLPELWEAFPGAAPGAAS